MHCRKGMKVFVAWLVASPHGPISRASTAALGDRLMPTHRAGRGDRHGDGAFSDGDDTLF
jgi:hypothetical protein